MEKPDAFTPSEVTLVIVSSGEKKAKQSWYMSLGKAWMAGWLVSFGAIMSHVVHGNSGTLYKDYPAIIDLIGAFLFPVGLITIYLTGTELLTANMMSIPLAALKGRIRIWRIPYNWTLMFIGIQEYAVHLAEVKTHRTFSEVVLRGIGCNFLENLGVWLGVGARDTVSQIAGIHFPVFAFVFLGFEHVVVNMFFIPMGMLCGADIAVARYIIHSIIPAFIGNLIGALLLGVPMLYFYHPPELPRFFANQRQLRQDEELTRRVTQLNDRMGGIVSGVSTPTALKAS